ncbi:MAG: helicase-exonuclease AddAB subunit AddB [Anaeromicrobium sp.]|jgi:ATP-dependent helicase/nuclease subunit B|uniref:helicase-exonuclease AddAB subunit AddB n=1 Tax=Anaeromicrobium sp. TaxID=1929132 RepID=UPI0025E89608|nr:helicase-exonuclease AddAB subunit AddB [Anaeromicrobium sp.]MCT4595815.1 helicase-exonuclease AddAB subunit AddB [Anaeromicrobium sp.]
MPREIKLIRSRVGGGKTDFVFRDILDKLKKEEKKLILIVPEQFTLETERDLIKKLKLKGIINIEVLSFTRLAHKVLREAGGITRTFINDLGKNMILKKIVLENNKNLTIYKKSSHQDGFINRINELIGELKQNNIMPKDLDKELEHTDENIIISQKLQDISLIYENFEDYLEGKYIDTENFLNLLIEKIGEGDFLKNSHVWIDGFSNFTIQMNEIIRKIINKVDSLTMTFTMGHGNDRDIFTLCEDNYRRIIRIIEDEGYSSCINIINLDSQRLDYLQKSEEISHLEKNIYAYPYKTYKREVENLDIFHGRNIYVEIEYVASKIIELIRDKNYRLRNIAVVSNDMDKYSRIIERVFKEYDIPIFLDQKRKIMNNPIIEFILSALLVIQKNYRYEDMFRYIKTGFTRISPQEGELIENYVLKYGIRGDRWKFPFKYGEGEYDLESLNKIRKTLVEDLEFLEEKFKGKKTVETITRGVYKFLEKVELFYKFQGFIDYLKDEKLYDYMNENTQIWNILMETLDQLVEIMGTRRMSLKDFIKILESGFEATEVGIIPTTIDQVLVGNISRSKSHDIKALFVVGVNDGILPKKREDDKILSSEERLFMRNMDIPIYYDDNKKSLEERFTIYSSLGKPTEYLWISYPLANEEGKALRPSILIDRIKKIFPKLIEKSDMSYEDLNLSLVTRPNSTFKYLVENLRNYVDGNDISENWFHVYNWYKNEPGWKDLSEQVINGLFYKNKENYIYERDAKNLYNVPIHASVSRLEKFVNCPFSHFIRYGLRPEERKIFEIKSPDVGELFHQSMEKFTDKLKNDSIDWKDLKEEESGEIVEEVIDHIIPQYRNGIMLSSNRYKYLVKKLKRISKRAIWTLTDHLREGGFKPEEYEVAFGINKKYPPIEIELSEGEKIYLEGRIDRVDIFNEEDSEYIKIIDYKSGNKEFSLSDVYNGIQLQLIIYLEAILKSQPHKKPAGIFYFKIDDPLIKTDEKVKDLIEREIKKKLKMKGLVLKDVNIIRQMDKNIDGYSDILPVRLSKKGEVDGRSSAIDGETFKNLIKHVKNLVKEISYEMMKGNIEILPCKNGTKRACDYCLYSTICEFDTAFHDNSYKNIKKLSKDEVVRKIREENK